MQVSLGMHRGYVVLSVKVQTPRFKRLHRLSVCLFGRSFARDSNACTMWRCHEASHSVHHSCMTIGIALLLFTIKLNLFVNFPFTHFVDVIYAYVYMITDDLFPLFWIWMVMQSLCMTIPTPMCATPQLDTPFDFYDMLRDILGGPSANIRSVCGWLWACVCSLMAFDVTRHYALVMLHYNSYPTHTHLSLISIYLFVI